MHDWQRERKSQRTRHGRRVLSREHGFEKDEKRDDDEEEKEEATVVREKDYVSTEETFSSRSRESGARLKVTGTTFRRTSDERSRVQKEFHGRQSIVEDTESSDGRRERSLTSGEPRSSVGRSASSVSRREEEEEEVEEDDEEEEKQVERKRQRRARRSEKRKRSERSRESRVKRSDDLEEVESEGRRNSRVKKGDSTDGTSGRRRSSLKKDKDELPITEILKKAQGDRLTKYEEPVPLSELTTDTIYVQGRRGFSAMKISGFRGPAGQLSMEQDGNKNAGNAKEFPAPIEFAIIAQRWWKSSGLVFQGLLAGMALMHFVMIQIFYDASMDFMVAYSRLSEIYTSLFSFLITLSVIAVFDKFDLARLDFQHLREIHAEHVMAVLVIPLYIVTFCLHQVTTKDDFRLASLHANYSNDSISTNASTLELFLDDVKTWQRVTISKDVLAVLAWLFISVGTRDDMLLMYLRSMEKYTGNPESSFE